MTNSPAVKSVPYISRPFPDPLPPNGSENDRLERESADVCAKSVEKVGGDQSMNSAGSFHRWKYAVRLAWGSVPKPRTWRALAFVSSGGAASITERDLEASDGR